MTAPVSLVVYNQIIKIEGNCYTKIVFLHSIKTLSVLLGIRCICRVAYTPKPFLASYLRVTEVTGFTARLSSRKFYFAHVQLWNKRETKCDVTITAGRAAVFPHDLFVEQNSSLVQNRLTDCNERLGLTWRPRLCCLQVIARGFSLVVGCLHPGGLQFRYWNKHNSFSLNFTMYCQLHKLHSVKWGDKFGWKLLPAPYSESLLFCAPDRSRLLVKIVFIYFLLSIVLLGRFANPTTFCEMFKPPLPRETEWSHKSRNNDRHHKVIGILADMNKLINIVHTYISLNGR